MSESKLTLLNTAPMGETFHARRPYDLAGCSEDTLPSGCPAGSSLLVVDKMAMVFCDGKDNWYLKADTPVAAGQSIAALF